MKQTVILNTAGFVGEEYIKEKFSLEITDAVNLSENIFEENKNPVFFRPSYEELHLNFNNLKNNIFTIILTPEQEKEKKLLESYFKITLLDEVLLAESAKDLLNIHLDAKQFVDLAKKHPGYKSLFCILHTEGLNYSYLENNFKHHSKTIRVYTQEDFYHLLDESSYSKKYLEQEKEADPIFYELLFSELIGEETVFVQIYKKILDDKQEFTPEEEKAIEELHKKHWLAEIEESEIKKLTFGYPIRDQAEINEWRK